MTSISSHFFNKTDFKHYLFKNVFSSILEQRFFFSTNQPDCFRIGSYQWWRLSVQLNLVVTKKIFNYKWTTTKHASACITNTQAVYQHIKTSLFKKYLVFVFLLLTETFEICWSLATTFCFNMTICKYWFELYLFVDQKSFSTSLKLLERSLYIYVKMLQYCTVIL